MSEWSKHAKRCERHTVPSPTGPEVTWHCAPDCPTNATRQEEAEPLTDAVPRTTPTSDVPPRFDVGGCSERGSRSYQEDALRWDAQAGVFAVADGLGAGGDGDVASDVAVTRVVELAAGRADWSAEKLSVESAHAADSAVRQAQSNRQGRCQTTLALLVVREGQAAVAWCGDSRVYRLRDGNLEQLTEDHRMYRNVLTKCLGATRTEEAEADFRTLDVQPGDVFSLLTDGVGDTLPPERLAAILGHVVFGKPAPAQSVAEALVSEALDAGSRDNCTAVVVRIGGAS